MPSDEDKRKERELWFNQINKEINKIGLFFLTIYEMEALFLADIETVNTFYSASISFSANPLYKEDPKGFLREKTTNTKRKYVESDGKELFEKLDFDKVYEKHHDENLGFRSFIDLLKQKYKLK